MFICLALRRRHAEIIVVIRHKTAPTGLSMPASSDAVKLLGTALRMQTKISSSMNLASTIHSPYSVQ